MTANLDSQIAFAMVVGPGEAEMAIDTLESILHFYPDVALWIRDDRSSDGTWEALEKWAEGKPVHLSRNPVAQGYYGIAKSCCDLLLAILQSGTTPEIVIKVDPDAVFLNRGLVEAF
jgi:glycosyltransferase involved in cell wall biosynthesis